MNKLLGGHRGQARGDRHRPPGVVRGRPARRARAARRRAAASRRASRTSCAGSGARTATLWAPAGHARGRGPARLADDRREDARGRCPTIKAFVARGARGGLHGRRPARHGRLEPRARGVPPLEPAVGGRAAPARARLHGAARGRARSPRRSTRRRRCSSSPRSPAGRSSRTRCSPTSAALRPDPRHFVAITDPGTSMAELAEREGFRRTFLSDPEIGGRYSALSPFGIVPGRARRAWTSRPCSRAPRSAAENCELPEGNSGLWLGAALGELAAPRPRQARPSSSTRRCRSFGLWAEQLVAESTGKQGAASCRSPTSRSWTRQPTAPDRVFVHLRDADAPDPRHEEAVRALAAAGHPTVSAHRRRRRRPGPVFFFARVRHRRGRLGAGDQPVRPAQRPGGQGQHRRASSTRARRPSSRTARSTRCSTASRRRLPGDHGLPALRRRGRRGGRGAAGARSSSATASPPPGATARASCTPPASSTRAGRRPAASSSSCTTPSTDAAIPGKPYGFRALIDAQADGDLQTLRDHGLPAVRVRLPAGDLAGAITPTSGAA